MAVNSILEGKFISYVPIAVYRELATELQLTQSQLAFYRSRYEQAHQQNQQIVQEVQSVMAVGHKIQAIVANTTPDQPVIPQIVVPQQVWSSPPDTEGKFHWVIIFISIVLVASLGLGFIVMNTLSAQKQRRA
jgi:hypothetical protein